jgi:hypothetical protein
MCTNHCHRVFTQLQLTNISKKRKGFKFVATSNLFTNAECTEAGKHVKIYRPVRCTEAALDCFTINIEALLYTGPTTCAVYAGDEPL